MLKLINLSNDNEYRPYEEAKSSTNSKPGIIQAEKQVEIEAKAMLNPAHEPTNPKGS